MILVWLRYGVGMVLVRLWFWVDNALDKVLEWFLLMVRFWHGRGKVLVWSW